MPSFTVLINGQSHRVDVAADTPLLWVLRDTLGLTGTKFGCGMAQCGACTVHLDGKAVRSCVTPSPPSAGKKVTTIEGLVAPTRRTRCSRRGSTRTCRSAATASRARSCPPPRCSRRTRIRPTTTSTARCPATFAAAGPISASAARSTARRRRR